MKKFFQIIGITTLACFSFIFTEKTAITLRDNDDLMKVIKEQSISYKIESENALVEDDTIIPGLNGKNVNNNKSYDNMKRFGQFNENMLIYDLLFPEISLKNTYNKYIIGGNPRKNMVTLIFKVTENSDINTILSTVDVNIPLNFFVDGNWLESNEESLKKLTDFNFVIGNLGYHGDYTKSGYVWINTIINRYSKQENNYCYVESKNEDYLKICALQKSYTIMPSIITKDNPLIEIKNNIKSGDIISLEINNQTLKQLPLIISYINSKGFKITSLDEFLSEDF
ncbi:MAG: hypothetical protein E7165_01540 [Firmicutes bacterium]|nr:hypothetical protein [Bacillota bacterium]